MAKTYAKRKHSKFFFILFLFLGTLFVLTAFKKKLKPAPQTSLASVESTQIRVKNISILKQKGGRVDWLPATDGKIAYDKKGLDGYYDVFTMNQDGGNDQCITCSHPLLPNRNQGQPAWHPSGLWLIFQAEKRYHPGLSIAANPGLGLYSDLWVISSDKKRVFQLTNIPSDGDHAVLHPHFSRDGKKLIWGEMYKKANLLVRKQEFGLWKIKMADFSAINGVPSISNIKEYQPIGNGWYETHGFSPDGSTIYFTSNANSDRAYQANIYAYSIANNNLQRLTMNGYNEHSQVSPNGKKIIWMHDEGTFADGKGTDYWVMNADGTQKQQLTFFREQNNSSYDPSLLVAADGSWNFDGSKYVGYVEGLHPVSEKIILLEF